MFYLLTHDGSISMCRFCEGWVYAWHFTKRNISGGGRLNPGLVTLKVKAGTWDIRKNIDLKVPDQRDLENEFNAWCDEWFKDEPKRPASPNQLGEIPGGKHSVPVRSIRKIYPF